MDIIFSMDGEINLLALYAAVLSTFIAAWEVLKWRKKACYTWGSFIPWGKKKF